MSAATKATQSNRVSIALSSIVSSPPALYSYCVMPDTPGATSDLQGLIDRNSIAVGQPVRLIRHPDDRHKFAEHGLAHSGPAGGFRVGRNAIGAAIGDRHRHIDHFLG